MFSLEKQKQLASHALILGQEMVKGGKYNLRWYDTYKSDSQVTEFVKYANDLGGFNLLSDLDKQEFFQMLYESPKIAKLKTEREQSRRIAQFLYAKLLGGRLITKMNELGDKPRDLLVLNMLKYAGSRSTLAGPHLKAGDSSTF